MTQLVQNPFKTRLEGVLLLHLNHSLITEMTLLVGMFINRFPCDFNGKLCHLYENVQNRLQNKNKFGGARKLTSKPNFHIISPSIIQTETRLFLRIKECNATNDSFI